MTAQQKASFPPDVRASIDREVERLVQAQKTKPSTKEREAIEAQATREALLWCAIACGQGLDRRLPRLASGDAAAMTEAVERLAAAGHVRLLWRHAETFTGGRLGYSRMGLRESPVPIIERGQFEQLAIAVHELGHGMAEPHAGAEHFNESKEALRCLTCEAAACEIGLRIAPTSMLRHVQTMASKHLGMTLSSTPATGAAIRRAERVRSGMALRHEQRRRQQRSEAWARLSKLGAETYD